MLPRFFSLHLRIHAVRSAFPLHTYLLTIFSAGFAREYNQLSPRAGGYGFNGIAYHGYNNDGSCKTESQVASDLLSIASSGYTLVRLYGLDCNQAANTLAAAENFGIKLFVSVAATDLSHLSSDLSSLDSQVGSNWASINTVSVGNGLVSSGSYSAADVVAAISQARSILQGYGYSGSVVAVDTDTVLSDNPSLCGASDYCAAICEPYYGGVSSSNAGSFCASQIASLRSTLANAGQTIVIAETGWPTSGAVNGNAVPSQNDQVTALNSIQNAFGSDPSSAILYEAFNSPWASPGQLGVNQYFGIIR